jgi:hypothetical protein
MRPVLSVYLYVQNKTEVNYEKKTPLIFNFTFKNSFVYLYYISFISQRQNTRPYRLLAFGSDLGLIQ